MIGLPELTAVGELEELDAVFAHAYNPFRRTSAYYTSDEGSAEAPKDGDIRPYASTDTGKPDVIRNA